MPNAVATLPWLRRGASAGARRIGNPLPPGAMVVGVGLLVNGLASYAFLVATARILGPTQYAPLSVLWALVFLIGPGFFLPIEQEVSRSLATRRVRAEGARPLLARAAMLGGALLGLVLAVIALASGPLLDRLLREEVLLLFGLILGVIGAFAGHLARGTLSGNGRFGAYALFLGGDATIRLLLAGLLAVVGAATAGPYGMALGLAPLLALALVMSRQRGLVHPGPPAPWSELSSALGWLLIGSVMAQVLINAGPLAIELLATEGQSDEAGRFLAGLIIGRLPLFLFQAVQASLLPRLSSLTGAGRLADFRDGLRRLLLVVAVSGAAANVGGFTIGPWVVRLLFGAEFHLEHRTVGLLAAGSAAYILAIAAAQALIALGGHARVAIGWSAGVVTFAVVTALGDDLFLRVEMGFLTGSTVAAVCMGLLLAARLGRRGRSIEPEAPDGLTALPEASRWPA